INTIWANKLASDFGVKAEQLQHDFCASAMASAYILKYNIILEGGDFWQGVGRYHSNTPARKAWYIGKVYQNSLRF
ncbi:lytic transglycosylase domain-containing protein, partial [Klebsiella pneumoniae]